MKDFMIDIETLGKSTNAVILSIGAVWFNIETGEVDKKGYYCAVDLGSCLDKGLKIDAETLTWWLTRDDKGNSRIDGLLNLCLEVQKPISEALMGLTAYICGNTIVENIDIKIRKIGIEGKRIWANSPQFDLMILENAFKACEREIPWTYKEMRDLRTLKDLDRGEMEEFDVPGDKHNALHDAILQAKICSHIWNWIHAEV